MPAADAHAPGEGSDPGTAPTARRRTSAWVLRPRRKARVTGEGSEEEERRGGWGGVGVQGRAVRGWLGVRPGGRQGAPPGAGPRGTCGPQPHRHKRVCKQTLSHRVPCRRAEEG